MDRAKAGPPASESSVVDDLERLRERLMRTDPEFFEHIVRDLETVTSVYRAKRAVEARSARELEVGQRFFQTRSGVVLKR